MEIEISTGEMHEHTTSGLASVGVYARGKFSGNLKVYRPSEFLCSPARTPSRRNVVCQAERALIEVL